MTLHPVAKRSFVLGCALLALAVLIGAFGAHGLKEIVPAEKLVTFETGVRYHFYHAFGIIVIGLLQQQFQALNLSNCLWSLILGILLFSFNCYFYVLTNMKIFALIVPLGGLLFILGWIMLSLKLSKLR